MSSKNYPMLELVNIDGCYITNDFAETLAEIENLEIRDDDVWVAGYPKSGTTWCQEMVFLLGTNLNYERAKIPLDIRFPGLENRSGRQITKKILEERFPARIPELGSFDAMEKIKQSEDSRFIKTHLPFNLLPKQIRSGEKLPKLVHIIRNPKQVASSYYFFSKEIWPVFQGDMKEFINLFIEGKVLYGSYLKTVLSYWNERHRPNLLIVTYEDMCNDMFGTLQKVSKFLGKSYGETQLRKLEHHLSFDEMRKNDSVNRNIFNHDGLNFMRKGKVDSYKEELTPELNEKLDKWIEENFKEKGLPFDNI